MSETPKTDAVAECLPIYGPSDAEYVPADFARQLERDLAASQARVARLEEALRRIESEAVKASDTGHPSIHELRGYVEGTVRAALGETGGRKP